MMLPPPAFRYTRSLLSGPMLFLDPLRIFICLSAGVGRWELSNFWQAPHRDASFPRKGDSDFSSCESPPLMSALHSTRPVTFTTQLTTFLISDEDSKFTFTPKWWIVSLFPIIRRRVLSPLYRSGTERQKSELREYRVFLFDGIAFENRFRLFITNAGFTSFPKSRIVSRYWFTLVDSMTRSDTGALCFQSNCVWASLKVTALFLETQLLLCSSDKGKKTLRWCFPVKITTADESVREPARVAVGGKCIVRFYMSTELLWCVTVPLNETLCKNCFRLFLQPL